jgi:hypothetical protein
MLSKWNQNTNTTQDPWDFLDLLLQHASKWADNMVDGPRNRFVSAHRNWSQVLESILLERTIRDVVGVKGGKWVSPRLAVTYWGL